MHHFRCLTRALPFLLLVGSASASDVWTPHKVERLRSVSAVAMSPDGAHVAYSLAVPRVAGMDEDGAPWSELRVLDTQHSDERTFVGGKVNVSGVAWAKDGRAITFLQKRAGDKETSLYSIALDGGEARKLVELETSISSYSFASDGARVALVATPARDKERKRLADKGFSQSVYEEDGRNARAWVVKLPAGKPAPLAIEGSVHQLVWSPVDERLAISITPSTLVDDEYVRHRVCVIDAQDGTVLAKLDNPGKLGAIGWSPDGKWVSTICGQDEHDPAAGRLWLWSSGLDPKLPVRVSPMADDWAGDVNAAAFQDGVAVIYVATHGVDTAIEKVKFWGGEAEYKTLLAPGTIVCSSVSLSKDGQHGAFVAHRSAHGPEVFTMNHGDTSALRRTDSNPWAHDVRRAQQELFTWKARDGLELQGVLVRPLDEKPGQRYPLVLSVHGGPEANEWNGWSTNYSRPGQMLAAKGIAVLAPNYRGSTGRGVAFSKLGQGDAAGKEFDDLVDAVDALIASGLVDGSKVGITGGSYGGYATAWCSTRYSERFAAGVMFVGISNKLSKLGTTDIPDEEYMVHALKRPWEAWDFFKERSPIFHTDKSHTPLLILGGKDDPRVDPGQSKEMYRWLKLRGQAPVRLVQYPAEGHGNRRACSRLDYALRMTQWFEHYLLGAGGPAPNAEIDYADPEAKAN